MCKGHACKKYVNNLLHYRKLFWYYDITKVEEEQGFSEGQRRSPGTEAQCLLFFPSLVMMGILRIQS